MGKRCKSVAWSVNAVADFTLFTQFVGLSVSSDTLTAVLSCSGMELENYKM